MLAGIFKMVFSNVGPVNEILKFFGMNTRLDFFSDGGLFRGLAIGSAVWQSAGWGAIIYLAALSGVDESLYEAAYVDGAGRLRQTFSISIPCIIPTIITVFILNLGNVLNVGYDQIYNMYNPTVYNAADIIDTYVMRALKAMDYGAGTAAELFKPVISFVLVMAAEASRAGFHLYPRDISFTAYKMVFKNSSLLIWNSWYDSLMYITDNSKIVVQVLLQRIIRESDVSLITQGLVNPDATEFTSETVKAATVIVAILPILLFYPFIQKYFTKGIMLGAVKG